jgi:hypothetical protein
MTVEQIDASIASLVAALSTSTLTVRFADGRSVTYRTIAEIREAIAALRSERGRLTAGAGGLPVAVFNAFPVRILR